MKLNINGVDLEIAPNANLLGANLLGADLCGADLSHANLRRARLSGADLCGANLRGANLSGADLNWVNVNGVRGNMREIKSAQFDRWPVTWTQSQQGITTLQIGCQSHDLEIWRNAEPTWIASMDPRATQWWGKYGHVILQLVDASPAIPYGKVATDSE